MLDDRPFPFTPPYDNSSLRWSANGSFEKLEEFSMVLYYSNRCFLYGIFRILSLFYSYVENRGFYNFNIKSFRTADI